MPGDIEVEDCLKARPDDGIDLLEVRDQAEQVLLSECVLRRIRETRI